jgi:Family of unknown function (DUF5519)
MGYIHGDRLVDLPFPMNIRNELVNSGRASSHHVLPQSGWISYWINKGEEDVPAVIELFRMRYEQLNQDHNHRSNKAEHQMTLSQTRNLLSCL